MVWIRTVSEKEATGKVREVYAHATGRIRKDLAYNELGQVGEVVKVFSIKPGILEGVEQFRTAIKDGASGLGRDREEMIAVVVASISRCTY
jgi:alkylhydroperoxidase family enzyme